jgi:hypothetical protein
MEPAAEHKTQTKDCPERATQALTTPRHLPFVAFRLQSTEEAQSTYRPYRVVYDESVRRKDRLRGPASIQSNCPSDRAMKRSPSTAQKSVVSPSCIRDDIRAAAARRFDTVGGAGITRPETPRSSLHRVLF